MHRVVKRIVFVTWMSVGASAVAGGAHQSRRGTRDVCGRGVDVECVQRFDVGTRVKLTVGRAPVVERYFVLLNDTR